jgi:hypothetical protein
MLLICCLLIGAALWLFRRNHATVTPHPVVVERRDRPR